MTSCVKEDDVEIVPKVSLSPEESSFIVLRYLPDYDTAIFASGYASIQGDKATIGGMVSNGIPGVNGGSASFQMYLKLEGDSFLQKKTYLLFNDSAHYGWATKLVESPPRYYSATPSTTGWFNSTETSSDTIHTLKRAEGSVTITNIQGKYVSGYFSLQLGFKMTHPLRWTNCCAVYEGEFKNLKVN